MDEHLKYAIGLAAAQASVRPMQEDELEAMIRSLAARIRKLDEGCGEDEGDDAPSAANSIRERSITCLECGKSFKLITAKHLASHGLDADAYRKKWGIKGGTPLVCKSLQRTRRKKMKDMQLWERRRTSADQS